jgi:hypothetical protein
MDQDEARCVSVTIQKPDGRMSFTQREVTRIVIRALECNSEGL